MNLEVGDSPEYVERLVFQDSRWIRIDVHEQGRTTSVWVDFEMGTMTTRRPE